MLDTTSVKPDPKTVAKEAGLRYVSDKTRGFGRQKVGKGFIYLDLDGKRITDQETIERIVAWPFPRPTLTFGSALMPRVTSRQPVSMTGVASSTATILTGRPLGRPLSITG